MQCIGRCPDVTGDGACNIHSSDSRRWPDTGHLSELIAKYRDDKNSTDRDIRMNDTESPSPPSLPWHKHPN